MTYIDEVVPSAGLAARWLGRDVPLHATSAGKALLAWSPEEDVGAAMEPSLPEFTATTQTCVDTLSAELSTIRESGFSVSVGELESEVYGVSVPVLNAGGLADAVVSVWGPKERVPQSRFADLGELLRTAVGKCYRVDRLHNSFGVTHSPGSMRISALLATEISGQRHAWPQRCDRP